MYFIWINKISFLTYSYAGLLQSELQGLQVRRRVVQGLMQIGLQGLQVRRRREQGLIQSGLQGTAPPPPLPLIFACRWSIPQIPMPLGGGSCRYMLLLFGCRWSIPQVPMAPGCRQSPCCHPPSTTVRGGCRGCAGVEPSDP